MDEIFDSRYPSIECLRRQACRRLPRFVFEYLEGGCFSEVNLRRNMEEIRQVQLEPYYLLADTPTFAYRPKEIKNGLSIPPRMSLRNVLQMTTRPTWSVGQLFAGAPEFKTMEPYMLKGLSMKHLGQFMDKTFSGRLDERKIAAIRDRWKGKLVVKGIVNGEDLEKAIELGADGIIVSNHGGRQLDSGQSSIKALENLAADYGDRTTLMIDSGLREGQDVASALACGAKFTFLGRSFMYGVGALGKKGGCHTITMLKRQLRQVMEQVACERVGDFPEHLLCRRD